MIESELRIAGFVVRTAVAVLLPCLAVIVELEAEPTSAVEIVKLADVIPCGIVTVAGTVAPELLELRVTTSPPSGAGALTVTVPVELLPPTRFAGLKLRLKAGAGLMARPAVRVVAPRVAEIVAFVVLSTELVVMMKLAEVAP